MIVDTVTSLSSYAGLSPRLATALGWLESTDLTGLDEGELKIDGDHIRAIVQRYVTVPDAGRRYEAHRRF